MIRDIVIDNLGDVIKLILDQERDHDIKRLRSPYIFRGLPNVSFKLVTSLQRNCKGQKMFWRLL